MSGKKRRQPGHQLLHVSDPSVRGIIAEKRQTSAASSSERLTVTSPSHLLLLKSHPANAKAQRRPCISAEKNPKSHD